MSANPPPPAETAPDPEEDDLDDLDDVLDSFAPKPAAAPPTSTASNTAPTASGPGRPSPDPTSTSAILDQPDDADLATDLQKGMEALIGELGENKEMQAQFEAMMAELIAAGQAPTASQAAEHVKSASESMPQVPEEVKQATASAGGGPSATTGGKKGEESFQETIRRTMERMQVSDSTAKSATTSQSAAAEGQSSEEQMLMELMKSLNSSGGGEGAGSEEDFNTMLMSMMTQLTNKEILYEPMKELHEKFPAWMEKHAATEEKGEMERYVEQQRLVGEIVGRFERKGYSDDNEEDRDFIVERMQKMQAAGSPPPDLVGDMSAAQEALGDLDAGCPTQ